MSWFNLRMQLDETALQRIEEGDGNRKYRYRSRHISIIDATVQASRIRANTHVFAEQRVVCRRDTLECSLNSSQSGNAEEAEAPQSG